MSTIYLLAKPQQELKHFDSINELNKFVTAGDTVTTLYPDGTAIQAEWAETPTGDELGHVMAEVAFYHEHPVSNQIIDIYHSLKGDEAATDTYIQLMAETLQETSEELAEALKKRSEC